MGARRPGEGKHGVRWRCGTARLRTIFGTRCGRTSAYFRRQAQTRFEARMALLADDDVVVHQHAERLGGGYDLLGHLDIGA